MDLKKQIVHSYRQHSNLVLYGVIGLTGALIDMLIYLVLVKYTLVPAPIASLMSVSMGVVNNFILNSAFNFKKHDHLPYRFASFYIVGLMGAVLSAILIYLLIKYMSLTPVWAKVATIIPVVLIQYGINKAVTFRDSSFSAKYQRYINTIAVVGPVVLLLGFMLYIGRSSPVGYDDAYNLQISSNLAQSGSYATNGAEFDGTKKLFDPYISTGAIVLVPTALMIKIFGNTLIAAQIVPIIFSVALIILLMLLVRRVAQEYEIENAGLAKLVGGILTVVITLSLANTENLLIFPLGEVPAVVCILAAALLLSNQRFALAAICYGFAINAKLISLLALPAFIVLVFVYAAGGLRSKCATLMKFCVVVAVPSLLFEVYRFVSLDYNFSMYKHSVKQMLDFIFIGGSGLNSQAVSPLRTLLARIESFADSIPIGNNFLAVVLLLCVVSFSLFYVVSQLRYVHIPKKLKAIFASKIISLLTLIFILWMGWWLLASDRNFYRHVFPALVLLVVLSVGVLLHFLKYRSESFKTYVLIVVYLLAITALIVEAYSFRPRFSSSTQKMDAVKVGAYYRGKELVHVGWWQNPEMQYLLNQKSKPVDFDQDTVVPNVLLDETFRTHDPELYARTLYLCDSVEKLSERYEVCELHVRK